MFCMPYSNGLGGGSNGVCKLLLVAAAPVAAAALPAVRPRAVEDTLAAKRVVNLRRHNGRVGPSALHLHILGAYDPLSRLRHPQ